LTKNDFHVSVPLSEHLKYDLLVEKEGVSFRVQVRYVSVSSDGKIHAKLQSSWSNKKGNHFLKRDKGDYDILAVYCPDTQKSYFVADQEFESQTSLMLRPDVESQRQKNMRIADDHANIERAFEIWKTLFLKGATKTKSDDRLASLTKEKIVEMKKTMGWNEIGFLYDVTGNTIRNRAKEYGLDVSSLKCRGKFSNHRGIVRELHEQGWSQRKIAREVGCSRGTVEYLIKNP